MLTGRHCEVGTHDLVLMFTSDLHLMPVRAASKTDRERVHYGLRKRMIKRFPTCCFVSTDVPFTFLDKTKGTVGMVSSYVGMMRAGRIRLLEEHVTQVTIGFTVPSKWNGGMEKGKDINHRKRLDPLCLHLCDDDPPVDNDDDLPAFYCGYFGTRWCERLCDNDGSERLVTCGTCEVRCCVESCISLPSRCCRHCLDFTFDAMQSFR